MSKIHVEKDDTSTVSNITVTNGEVHIVVRGNSKIGNVHVGPKELELSKGKVITANSGHELHEAFKALGDAIVDKHVDRVFGNTNTLMWIGIGLIMAALILGWVQHLIP